MSRALGLYDKLLELNRCPVCGAVSVGPKTLMVNLTRRFECGAAFAYQQVPMAIVVANACPTGSTIQADLLTAEVMEERQGAA